ncbi:MAG TPA: hypothetical protein VI137_12775 [Pseudolabrys sp.]|jgi:hypothetical protein
MTKDDNKTEKSAGRSRRLAAALRENLRKRKAQERGRAVSSGAGDQPKANSATRGQRIR